jgi:hypothetical protein
MPSARRSLRWLVTRALDAIIGLAAIVVCALWIDSHQTLRVRWTPVTGDFHVAASKRPLWSIRSMCGKIEVIRFYNPKGYRPGIGLQGMTLALPQRPGPVRAPFNLADDCTNSALGFGFARQDDPTSIVVVVIPYWAVATLLGILLRPHRLLQLRHRHPPGTCQKCGYDLRATPDRCPECGEPSASISVKPTA